MFGTGRRIESVLAALRAENSDLRTQLRLEREEAAQREKVLFDRVLALTNPGALRQVVRASAEHPPEPPSPFPSSTVPHRIHYPGQQTSLRPPSPASPTEAPDTSPKPLDESVS